MNLKQSRFSFLNELNLNKDVVSRLSSQLARIEEGNDLVLRSPIGKSLDPYNILSRWDKVFNSKLSVITPDLEFLEKSNRSMYGPRSVAIPWSERRDRLMNSFSEEGELKTIADAIETPSSHALRPITYIKAASLIKRDTNSGLPFFQRKGRVIGNYLNEYHDLLQRQDSCILFTRTQELSKTRDVWGYPTADSINEMRFYKPLLDYQRRLIWRSALSGPDAVDKHITQLIKLSTTDSDYKLVSIDFSQYDASVKTTLQKYAFNYIKGLFQQQYSSELDGIAKRFRTIGIVTPDGLLEGPHGVPSGSTFTNEVDSIAQYLCASSLKLSPHNFDIQGDDGAYVVKDPDQLKNAFRSQGLVVNESKSYISDTSFVYLQNLHSTDYVKDGLFRGIYPTYRALNRILFPERFTNYNEIGIKGTEFNSIRTITILENCSNHPLFSELVKFVYDLDKTGLQYSQQGLAKYIKHISKSSGVEGIFNYRYEDNIRGINNFKTVKLILSLNAEST